jgi:bifunctional UDP-N-acetylglucosamine pyrophosphorylase/glucosamine-1-phosphate N-acetyltransferase
MQKRINDKWLLEGVIIIEPVYIDVSVELAPDTIIYPNTFIQGNSTIDANCHLGPGSIIKNSVIRENCSIIQSMIEAAVLEQNVAIGPYSHVRPDSYIGQNVHVGNFVEVKNSHIGNNTQMGHFSYIGDATIGNNVNIGAGVVTCNFDGSRKHETIIDDSAFIGSDSMIVAPIHIGAGASTGAGSIVTKDVPPNTFVVGMPARITSKKKTNLDT